MEPKKKRGRPKGCGKKDKIGPFNPDKLQEEFDSVFVGKEEFVPPTPLNDLVKAWNVSHPEQHTSIHEVKPYAMTPELEGAIENAMAEVSPPIKIQGYNYPSNWDTMGKIERLKWLKNNKL